MNQGIKSEWQLFHPKLDHIKFRLAEYLFGLHLSCCARTIHCYILLGMLTVTSCARTLFKLIFFYSLRFLSLWSLCNLPADSVTRHSKGRR